MMVYTVRPWIVIALTSTAALSGCSDDEGEPTPDASVNTTDAGAPPPDAANERATSDGASDGASAAPLLEPPAAGKGIQLTMTSTIAPGIETERCLFVKAPASGLNIVREEVRYTVGSHHVLLYMTPYKEIPTKTAGGMTVDTSGVVDCGMRGATGDWDVIGVVGGSQAPNGKPSIDQLPAGTAIKVPPNAVLLINTHYLNAGAESLNTRVYINLYTIPDAEVQQEAGVLFFYNPVIRVPANGKAEARQRCPVRADITLVNAVSHMHARGVDYASAALDPTTGMTKPLFATKEWADVDVEPLSPPVALKAGTLIDWRCSFDNKESRVITQGRTTGDEMCMFVGVYYPRHLQTEVCGLTADGGGRYMGGIWVGNGAADGAATLGCISAAKSPSMDQGDTLWGCVVDSCPKIAPQVSDFLRCQLTSGLGMCAEPCGMDPAACKTCVTTTCMPTATALGTAACQ